MARNKAKQRYARQTVLPEIGEAGQAKISNASVLCVGAGGLGCPALLYLAAAGVGNIGIIDFDNVDESNLQRQTLFDTTQIGQNKAQAAKTRLDALNPDIKITALTEKLTADNAEALFENYDIIIDGTDNFTAKFLINDAALKTGKPFIYGSILGFDGQLAVFNHAGNACYRCLFPQAPKTPVMNCAEAGIIGAVAGMIGTSQAMEAIKLIVAHPDFKPLSGKLWTLDAKTLENKILSLNKDPDCICANPKGIQMQNDEITVAKTKANTTAQLIDVREQEEWDAGHIESAELFPLSQLTNGAQLGKDKNTEIILHCKGGFRSMQALQLLRAQGYTNLKSMAGGFDAWAK